MACSGICRKLDLGLISYAWNVDLLNHWIELDCRSFCICFTSLGTITFRSVLPLYGPGPIRRIRKNAEENKIFIFYLLMFVHLQ